MARGFASKIGPKIGRGGTRMRRSGAEQIRENPPHPCSSASYSLRASLFSPPSQRACIPWFRSGNELVSDTFLIELIEFGAGLGGRLLDLAQELLLVVVDLAVGEQHLAQPFGFPARDSAVAQHVLLDGLEKQRLELGVDLRLLGLGLLLGSVAQLDEELDFLGVDLAVGPQFLLQHPDFAI